MILGTVKGEIVATIEHAFYSGRKKLIVEKEDFTGKPSGGYLIAIDAGVAAGVGDRVLVLDEGNSARQIVNDKNGPIRSIIIGIVDRIDSVL
jgi:microcompartment protein CcmK/EutM